MKGLILVEKTLIKGDFSKNNVLANVFLGLFVISAIIAKVLGNWMHGPRNYNPYGDGFVGTYIAPDSGEGSAVFFYLAVLCLILGIFIYIKMKSCQIVITDKRVYGKTSFGKHVDLPLDKISSVGMSFPKCITVASSSGVIKFYLINNRDDVHDVLSKLLINRQEESGAKNHDSVSDADEIKKYKELLDSNIITQEEFDAKKRQILGL